VKPGEIRFSVTGGSASDASGFGSGATGPPDC
jgi:hypothetical protein